MSHGLRCLAVLLLTFSFAKAQEISDPCETLLSASVEQQAWPGIVRDVLSGDTLLVQLKGIGLRRIRLAGLRAPQGSLAPVSRFHLSRLAKGLRIFVVLDPPWTTWPEEVVAPVEDFTEAQLAAGLARFVPEEEQLLGPYASCRCQRAEDAARKAKAGVWAP
jgi:endonuclease YncB( thermonuclease family)